MPVRKDTKFSYSYRRFQDVIFESCLVFATHVIKKVAKVLGMYVYQNVAFGNVSSCQSVVQ